MRNRQLILPAFGEFTGAALAMADLDTELCAVAGERLISRPSAAEFEMRGDG